jgi:Zn finger protein HypA/HybF involved in hydrogenase expression
LTFRVPTGNPTKTDVRVAIVIEASPEKTYQGDIMVRKVAVRCKHCSHVWKVARPTKDMRCPKCKDYNRDGLKVTSSSNHGVVILVP